MDVPGIRPMYLISGPNSHLFPVPALIASSPIVEMHESYRQTPMTGANLNLMKL